MRQRNWKYIIVAMIVVFAVVLGIRQTHFQSVDSYRQEQRQLAKDVSDPEENELASMYDTPEPQQTKETDKTASKANKVSGPKSSDRKEAGKGNPKLSGAGERSKEKPKTSGVKESSDDKSPSGTDGGKSSAHDKKKRKPSHSSKPVSGSDNTEAPAVTDTQNNENTAAGQDTAAAKEDNSNSSAAEEKQSSSPAATATATAAPKDERITCTIEIRCDSLVENKKNAQESIWKYIPSNGQIMEKVSVKVDKGASVYDVLEKACKAKNVALDSDYTPMYKSYYVRGIGNIYEKQAGDMSGWIYKVNGKAPNRGASIFKVSDGDEISWRYTCDGRTT